MLIAHLSDIHIRKTRRHEEYKIVLENLVASLESLPIDRIVIAGDLLHNKTDLSPEAVQLASDYLDRLSDIVPVDLILGNHDCVINQHNRLDSLTPIVSLLKSKGKPITLYEESGLYDVNDELVYGIFAQQDTKHQWPINFDKKQGKKYVALYHGAIDGSHTSASHRIESETDKSVFRNYDFGMLGDIHSRQPMILDGNGSIKVAYAGSLIQQNFGESIEKGFLLWDLDQKKCIFIEVANDWGFKTFRLDQEAIDNIENIEFDLPIKPYVRILLNTSDYNVTTAKHVESVIRGRYKPEGLFIEVDVQSTVDDLSLSGKPENVTDLKTQQDLLQQYFAKRPTVSEQEVNEILSIHKAFYDTCTTEDYDTYKSRKWVIHKVLFDNVFSYGPNNIINFDKMKGLTGIFSPNASGKSSILYTILQGFFNSSNRTGGRNVADVIHKNQNEGSIEIEFSVDDKRYVIERVFKRNKRNPNRANNQVKLYQIVHGDKVNISGEANVRETETAIRNLLGSYEEHTMTTFSQQFDITRWIDHGQTNRKDLLARFLGLNIIDDLQKSIKEETSSLKTLLKEYQQNDFPSVLSNFESQRLQTVDVISDLTKHKDDLEKTSKELLVEKEALVRSLNNVVGGVRDINDITSDKKKTNKNVDKLTIQLSNSETNLEKYSQSMDNVQDEIKGFSGAETLTNRLDKYNIIKEENTELKTEMRLKEQLVDTKKKQTTILNKHDWFETNDSCKKCSFLDGARLAKIELEEESQWVEKNTAKLEEQELWLNQNSTVESDYKIYQKLLSDKDKIKSKLELNDANKSNIDLQLELENNKLNGYDREEELYIQNQEFITHNNQVNKKISTVESKILSTENDMKSNSSELAKANSYLSQLTQKITDLGGNIEMLKELEKKYNLHALLMDAFSNDGIPLMIMNKTIPLINNEIRKILSNVTNFEVSLEIDTDDQNLSIFIDDGTSKRRVELGSGMEKTLTALTIRSALSNISLLPTCNLFVIDEGFGTLDSENINHMNMLLGYLKSKFDNVLIISHIESMQDITNNVINITKNQKGYSSVKIM